MTGVAGMLEHLSGYSKEAGVPKNLFENSSVLALSVNTLNGLPFGALNGFS